MRGELVAPAQELVARFALTLGSRVAGDKSAQTLRTYRGACERFAGWLVAREGPHAGAEHLTLESVAAYEAMLRGSGLSEATIRKDRSAIARFVRFLAEFELIDRGQARLVLARRLPAAVSGERERPKCLDEQALGRLICAAEATVARDPLQGRRDVAIVRVLAASRGSAPSRCARAHIV